MNRYEKNDFREDFKKMASHAIVSRAELALLLSTSQAAISQMGYRGELPATAFPAKRRACWFVGDIRTWLEDLANSRTYSGVVKTSSTATSFTRASGNTNFPRKGISL